VSAGDVIYSLVAPPYAARDTVFLPLHWLSEIVPRVLHARYRWDAVGTRLSETARPVAVEPVPGARPAPAPRPGPAAPTVVVPKPAAPPARPVAGMPHPTTGLRQPHTVVIDPGHGGPDPGNPGLYFHGGVSEKDVTLAIGRLLRAELVRRGITAVLTRARDTLIDLADRGALCRADCDLFVSVHVNAMPPGRRQRVVRGVETYFLSDAKTEDQKRVAKMENDAIRFETDTPLHPSDDLAFILRDLQQNEYLRESARAATLVQQQAARVHPGGDRGVQQAGFMVLSTARRPAILIEAGFATNRDDARFLTSAVGQHRIASALADGVIDYLLEFERKLAVGQ
jgi:N-acetylmuramoyl-L-alanine amidase